MEVVSDSFRSALQEEYSEQQQSGMVIKYHSKSPFMFFIFSEMTEAVCEDRDRHNAPTDESRSQFVAPSGSSEKEPSLKEIDSRDIILLTEADVPGASLNNKDPSELNVTQLKRWLTCRGAPLTGKKPELIER